MKTLRLALALVTLGVLVLGYLASQTAYFQGLEQAIAYGQRVDSPAIAMAALGILVAIVAFALIPRGNEEASEPTDGKCDP